MARIGKGQSVLLSGGMAMALLLAGCYSYPPLPEPVTKWGYTELKSGAHRGLPADCTMLTMAEAQSIALRNNPDYRSARHAMAAASARLYQSLTTYLPTLNATYDLTETRRNGGVMPAHVYSNKTLGFGAEWVVFNGLMGTMTALAARHDLRESEALERDARRLLLEAVGVAYNQVLLTREGIGISMADEEFNRKLLRETELKHEAGATALSEVLNFRIRVNDARSDLVRSEYSFATARSVLAELLGLTEGTLAAGLFPPLGEATSATLPDVDVFLDLALANRPDLAALREALKSAKYRLYARYGAFLPTVTLHSDFGWQRSDNDYSGRWKFRTRTQDRNFNYGVTGQWELFDGGGRWFALRESQADLAQSMESLTEAWIAIVAQVRQAHDNRKQQAILAAIAAENLELVQKTRDLVEEEYKAGNTSLTRLNEAQRDLIIAENNLVSARINLANARLNLDAVTAAIDLPEPPK